MFWRKDLLNNINKKITGVVFCTTNLITYEKYIGKDELNRDSYLGSGTILRRVVNKHGKENFKKEILGYAYTRIDLIELENYFLEYFNCAKSNLFYNIKSTSENNDTLSNHPDREKIGKKISKTKKQYFKNHNGHRKDAVLSEETKKKLSLKSKIYAQIHGGIRKGSKHTKKSKLLQSNYQSNREKVECENCHNFFDPCTINRWHNNNCKFKTKAA